MDKVYLVKGIRKISDSLLTNHPNWISFLSNSSKPDKPKTIDHYIRANSLDEALEKFGKIDNIDCVFNNFTSIEFTLFEETVQAVYFTDDPKNPLYILCETKEEAKKDAKEYLKEVGVKAKIDRIETI